MKCASVAVFDSCGAEPLVFSLKARPLFKIGLREGDGLHAVLRNEASLEGCCGNFTLGIIQNDDGTYSPIMLSTPSISPTVLVNGSAVKLNSQQVILKDGDHLLLACKSGSSTKTCRWGRCFVQYREEGSETQKKPEQTVRQPRKTIEELPEEVLQMIFARLDPLFVFCTLPAVSTVFHSAVKNGVPFPSVNLNDDNYTACMAYMASKFFRPDSIEEFSWNGKGGKEFLEGSLPKLLASVGQFLKKLQLKFTDEVNMQEYPRFSEELNGVISRNFMTLRVLRSSVPIVDLPALPELTELAMNMQGANLTCVEDVLSKIPKVTHLNLNGRVSDSFWRSVKPQELQNLTHVAVTFSASIPFPAFKNVAVLSVVGITRGNHMRPIADAMSRMDRLEHLNVKTGAVVLSIGALKDFIKKLPVGLVTLALDVSQFNDECCKTVAERCPQLETFYCASSGASGSIGASGVDALVKGCTKLRSMAINPDRPATSNAFLRAIGAGVSCEKLIPEHLRTNREKCQRELGSLFGFGVDVCGSGGHGQHLTGIRMDF